MLSTVLFSFCSSMYLFGSIVENQKVSQLQGCPQTKVKIIIIIKWWL